MNIESSRTTPPRKKGKKQVVTQEILDRIALLRKEGMIASWIAEDVGLSEHKTSMLMREMGLNDKNMEWRSAFSAIRNNPVLLRLHREFTPGNYAS